MSSSSNVPDQSSPTAIAACVNVAAAGVPRVGCSRPANAGNTRSRAIANATRGPVSRYALTVLTSASPSATEIRLPAPGPNSAAVASPATCPTSSFGLPVISTGSRAYT